METTNCVYGSITWKNVHMMVVLVQISIKTSFMIDHIVYLAVVSMLCRPLLKENTTCCETVVFKSATSLNVLCHIINHIFHIVCSICLSNIFFLKKKNICFVFGMQDVTARGIDVPMVDLVVQFSSPHKIADYVHRVGRTARAGRSGRAILFLCPNEIEFIRTLESKRIR